MSVAQSRITAQGQVSIPAGVMRQLGLAPGEVVTWAVQDGQLVIEKVERYALEEVQAGLALPADFHHADGEIRAGIKARFRTRHAVG